MDVQYYAESTVRANFCVEDGGIATGTIDFATPIHMRGDVTCNYQDEHLDLLLDGMNFDPIFLGEQLAMRYMSMNYPGYNGISVNSLMFIMPTDILISCPITSLSLSGDGIYKNIIPLSLNLTSITFESGFQFPYYMNDGSLHVVSGKLTSITNLNPNPPMVYTYYFNAVDKNTVTLYVPCGSGDAYRTANVWKDFANIVEIDCTPTGLERTNQEQPEIVGYYNLLGQKLSQKPVNGIYIILYDNGKTEKVIQ